MDISRRRFLSTCAASGGVLLAAGPKSWALEPLSVENPLGAYPNRDWEKVYLDQYRYDSTFTWIYVWVDANELDRPYIGWKDDTGPRHKAFRCLVRVKLNPGLPYNFTIMKHTGWIATERSVKAHETRPDGRALVAETGYQASYRYGSHQSITRNWMMPMHQTDTLFHKKTGGMGFIFGADVDNHAINTVPKETLVRITRAEAGGIGGVGAWGPARTGYSPGEKTPQNAAYLTGAYIQVEA